MSEEQSRIDEDPKSADSPSGAPSETVLGPKIPPSMPARIGHYHLRRVIASGGMGTVYEAIQEHPRRRVALKVMKAGIASRSALRRFEFESQILGRLRHPGIAQIFEAGTHDDGAGGVPYFAMEYVPNAKPITEYVKDKKLSIHDRLQLFAKVCDAVHHGHQKGIIHRDLKPANILVESSGEPKIIDFGVARATDSDLAVTTLQTDIGQLIGTLQYMSPEQCDADPEDLDTRSDVYALGVVLYELLCDQLPYDLTRVAVFEVAKVIRETVPPKPSTLNRTLRGDVETIALKALEKDRARRYSSAGDFGQDIRRYLNNEPIAARPPSVLYLTRKLVAKNKGFVLLVVGAPILLSLVGGTIAATWGWQTAVEALHAEQDQRQIAEAERARAEAAEQRATDERELAELASAQAETERQRAERRFELVRDLARVFMFDFHDAIQTLDGSLPARELLVTTALEYLESLAREAGDSPALRRELAWGYDRVGDIRGGRRLPSLGDIEGALESYQTALALRLELVAESPDNPELAKELSTSHIKVGDTLTYARDVTGALEAYREALNIREALAAADPKYLRDVSVALNAIGRALRAKGELALTRQYYDRSLVIMRQLAEERPEDSRIQRNLSVAYNRVAGLLAEVGDYEAALAHYEEAVEIREGLLESEPDSGRAKRDLAVEHYYIGRVHLALEQPQRALEHGNEFLGAAERQTAASPTDARAARDLAIAHELVGRALLLMDDAGGAEQRFRRFHSLIKALSQSDPTSTEYRRLVARSYERLGEVAAATGSRGVAITSYSEALQIVTGLSNADPDDTRLQADRARILTGIGRVMADLEERDEARHQLEASRELYVSVRASQPDHAELRNGLTGTLHELSKVTAALGDGEAALGYARDALFTGGTRTPSILRAFAVGLDLTGDTPGALRAVEEALRRLDEGDGGPEADELRRILEADLQRYRK